MGWASGPTAELLLTASWASRERADAVSRTVVAAVSPAPFRNPRRDTSSLGVSGMGKSFVSVVDRARVVRDPDRVAACIDRAACTRKPGKRDQCLRCYLWSARYANSHFIMPR